MLCYRLKNKGKSVIVTETELNNIYYQFQRIYASRKPILIEFEKMPTRGALEQVNLLPVTAIKASINTVPVQRKITPSKKRG